MTRVSVQKAGLIGMALLALAGCDNAGNKQTLAWVDVASVVNTEALSQQEKTRNEQVQKLLQSVEKEAQTRYESMDKEARQRAMQADAVLLNNEWQIEQARTRRIIIDTIVQAAEEYRKQHNISLIVDKTQIVTADPSLNVTEAIAASVKDKKIDFGELPDVKMKPEQDNAAPAAKEKKEK